MHYTVDIIAQFFRWYLSDSLNLHNLEEMMTERGIIHKCGANTAALATLNTDKPDEEMITIRQNKYLNNVVGRTTGISNIEYAR